MAFHISKNLADFFRIYLDPFPRKRTKGTPASTNAFSSSSLIALSPSEASIRNEISSSIPRAAGAGLSPRSRLAAFSSSCQCGGVLHGSSAKASAPLFPDRAAAAPSPSKEIKTFWFQICPRRRRLSKSALDIRRYLRSPAQRYKQLLLDIAIAFPP